MDDKVKQMLKSSCQFHSQTYEDIEKFRFVYFSPGFTRKQLILPVDNS